VLSLGNIKGEDGINGTDGKNGLDGINGANGTDGKNGADGITPLVRINDGTKIWEVSYDNGESWESLDHPSYGPAGDNGITPMIKINPDDGCWCVSYDNGSSWTSTGVNAEGSDGKDGINGVNGEDGRGIAKMEIIDGYLFVTYTDNPVPINIGKVSSDSAGGTDGVEKDVYSDALAFYPNSDGMSYSVSIGKAIYMETIIIPSTYNGKPVTAILPFGFEVSKDEMNYSLKNIVIPDTVVIIGEEAFSSCSALEYIFVPSSVQKIDHFAFYGIDTVEFEIAESDIPEGEDWTSDQLGCPEIKWKM
jgi:hypothetical protein